MATNKKQVNIRLQPSVHEKLRIVAEKDKRTVTNLVEYWVEKNLSDYEKDNGKISITQNNNNSGNGIFNNEIKM